MKLIFSILKLIFFPNLSLLNTGTTTLITFPHKKRKNIRETTSCPLSFPFPLSRLLVWASMKRASSLLQRHGVIGRSAEEEEEEKGQRPKVENMFDFFSLGTCWRLRAETEKTILKSWKDNIYTQGIYIICLNLNYSPIFYSNVSYLILGVVIPRKGESHRIRCVC